MSVGTGHASAQGLETASANGAQNASDQAHQIKVRRMLGLAGDEESRRRAATPGAQVRTTIPVTPTEAGELDRRRDLAIWNTDAQPDFASAGNFGGSWMEPTTGALHVSFVGEPSARAQARLATKPGQSKVVVDQVARTEAQLANLQERVWEERPGLGMDGVDVISSFVDLPSNTLTVDVRDSDGPRARRAMQRRFGSEAGSIMINPGATQQAEGTRDFGNGPVHGGQWLSFANGADCTAGFAQLRSNSVSSDFYVVTAGHCSGGGIEVRMGENFTGVPLGRVHRTLTTGPDATTSCDCMIIGPISIFQRSSSVRVNGNAVIPFERSGASSDYTVGMPACVSGAASYEAIDRIHCSTIRANNGTTTVGSLFSDTSGSGTKVINQTVMVGTGTRLGDSGAPWGQDEAWMGVHQGVSGGNNYFGRTNTLSALNVTAVY